MAGRRAGAGGNGDLAGVLPVFQTPFDDHDRIDYPALEKLFDWVFANGADGVVFAMVSEILRMSSRERDEVTTVACRLSRGRGCCVISVGAESLAAALGHARHAADSGADAVMATPPLLHAAGDDELLRYFTTIAARADVPLIVQDASGYVGRPLSIGLQARLHGELGDRVMFKPEAPPIGPRLTRLLERHRWPGQGLRRHRGAVPDRQLPPRGDRHHAGQRRGVGAVGLVARPRGG